MDKLTFKELAVKVLKATNKAMTPRQMWEFAVAQGWDRHLQTFDEQTGRLTGKTPEVSFCRVIYTNEAIFEYALGTEPKQFRLKSAMDEREVFVFEQPVIEPIAPQNLPQSSRRQNRKSPFDERDLHPVLCTFLRQSNYFNAYAKTIFHETSIKTTKGADRWLYPDMVAVNLEYENYKTDVSEFIKRFASLPVKVFSFELKKELNFGNYKESFFQAVSNSSWANEGYLVSYKLPKDKQFIKALQKLSQSFGIGVIQLNLEDVSQSQILFPAKFKEKMDYATIGELAEKNGHFSEFLQAITHPSSDFLSRFDEVLEGDRLTNYLIKLRG